MVALKGVLFAIKRSAFLTEQRLLERVHFCSITCSVSDQQDKFISDVNNEENSYKKSTKLVKVAMLGLPNVGKSTLINQLTRRAICPTSSKVHTTMHKADAVYNEGNTQIVFIDTPGLTTKKEMKSYKLAETFEEDPKTSAKEADIIGIIQDATNVYTRHKLDNFVLDYINNRREDAQLLLIFNKVDRLKKKQVLLDLVKLFVNKKDYPKFNDIFMISALSGDGVNDLRTYLLDTAKEGDWKYGENLCTDQKIENVILETVRAKLMDTLPDDMPYKIKLEMEHFELADDASINTVVKLNCPMKYYVRALFKDKAFKIKWLSFHAEKELRNAFRTNITVRLNVQYMQK